MKNFVLVAALLFGTAGTTFGQAYQQALASAQYRAANGIHGHSYLDTNRTSGVGWASGNRTPKTCLGTGGPGYAVVRGSDGWYATKIASSTNATSYARRRLFRVRQ